ncbi:MarR family winged helix-turn-helix transcriptional regulator [Pedobacter nototheniae]|uniref:MarR family winged helix-turn-helix transcriptional regulator n=1 Tax=Pedobacter nototheniae TaxID=2488994 RepID=UPI0010407FD7|nr:MULTISPECIES: MarR family transcriptional regulator [Pedobacter]
MDILKLENQLCFPLYALSRVITAHYKPLLAKIELTYPQYLVMLVLWEYKSLSVKELGEKLLLDSGTLTPLLKRLEEKVLVKRERSKADERMVFISLTENGLSLKKAAQQIPKDLACSLDLSEDELISVKNIVFELLEKARKDI